MANPLYYMHRHAQQVMIENPGMTQERYMEGFDRTNTLVNTMIGIANEVARLAISDGIDAIKQEGLYKQKTKQLCNETLRRQEAYESVHNANFGDRLKLWLDYLDGTEDEYRRHIFNIYMAVKQTLDKHKQSRSELKARLVRRADEGYKGAVWRGLLAHLHPWPLYRPAAHVATTLRHALQDRRSQRGY